MFVLISVMIRDNFGRYIIFGAEECDGRPLTYCHVMYTPTCTAPDVARKLARYILFGCRCTDGAVAYTFLIHLV